MEKTEGDLKFQEVKLARDLDLHSRTRQALATEIAEYSHKKDQWNMIFNTNHGIEPVTNYFAKKVKKNHQNVKDLIFAKKLPGPQTVEDLKNKMRLPHNYEE